MTCYHPIPAYQDRETNANGRRPLNFHERTARPVTVACGNCIGCRLERSRQWAVRLTHENQMHDLSSFVTLTYSPENEPPGRSLVKAHVQSFFKRLRKAHKAKLRYFYCGEYGETTQRPHYHALIFGIDFADKKQHSITPSGHATYTSETLEKIWGLGHCLIGSVTPESINYVSSYILKKVTGEKQLETYRSVDLSTGEVFDRLPPFICMSNRPGIGAAWFDAYAGDVFPSDHAIDRGKALGVPKYYTRRHLQASPEAEDAIKAARKRKALAQRHNSTPVRLAQRKAVKEAQLKINERKTI